MKSLLIFILFLQSSISLAQITPSIGLGNSLGVPHRNTDNIDLYVAYNKISGLSPTYGISFGGFKSGATLGYYFNSQTYGSSIITVGNTNFTTEKFRINSHYIVLKDILGNKLYGFDRHFFSIDYLVGTTDISILDYGNFKNYAETTQFRDRDLNQWFYSFGFSFYKKILNPNIYLYTTLSPTFYSETGIWRMGFNLGIMTPFR